MGSLIKIELLKIFHKKSIFIILGFMIIFLLLNNILYWKDYDEEGNYRYENQENLKQEKEELQEELQQYDIHKISDKGKYIALKTNYDIILLKEEYDKNSWQYKKINDYFYDILYQINTYTIEENKQLLQEAKINYEKTLKKLKTADWQYFINLEKKKIEQEQTELKEQLSITIDENGKEELNNVIKRNNETIKILNYRLQWEIKEDNSYLNKALEKYQQYLNTLQLLEKNKSNHTWEEKLEYRTSCSEVAINQYIIENKINLNKENTLNYNLRTIVADYELFLVLIVLIVASIMICDEFHKGTIKLLLIKPYSRVKILIAKYIATILILIFSILILIGMQLLVGGILFGFDSLTMPVMVYHYNTSSLEAYSVFQYMLIHIFSKLPLFIILLTISFGIGILSTSIITSIMTPLVIYMFSSSIHELAMRYHLEFMKYFITLNWNFDDYLFGGISDLPYLNFKFSVQIWLAYFLLTAIVAILLFQKKNIRNI